jgi:hypothetical protein
MFSPVIRSFLRRNEPDTRRLTVPSLSKKTNPARSYTLWRLIFHGYKMDVLVEGNLRGAFSSPSITPEKNGGLSFDLIGYEN